MGSTNRRVLVLALAGVLVFAGAEALQAGIVSTVTEEYGNPTAATWTVFDAPDPALQSTSTGFRWTAYARGYFFALYDVGGTLIDSRLSGHMTGSYAYTIFDSAGGNQPDTHLYNLQAVTIDWNSVGGGGTGTAAIMIRDADGRWFLSDQAVSIVNQTSQTLDVTTATWQSLDGTLSTLNDVTDDDTGPLAIGPAATPNLSFLTGGGFFIASDTYSGPVAARVDSMTFTGMRLPEPSTFLLALGGLLGVPSAGWRRRRGRGSARLRGK